jgi:RNA polymerase sigma-70 factor (ECF subfamily)
MSLDISALYQLYRKELINHLLRIVKCPETAQDLVQESYIILTRTAADVAIDHPRGFLYRTAGNLALDHLRHNKVVERHLETEQIADEAELPSVESDVSKAQWQALLHQTITELPPRCRDVFILHKIRGLSYREVARMLDITESAVEKHIIKGLQHCRHRLGQHFNIPTQ